MGSLLTGTIGGEKDRATSWEKAKEIPYYFRCYAVRSPILLKQQWQVLLRKPGLISAALVVVALLFDNTFQYFCLFPLDLML